MPIQLRRGIRPTGSHQTRSARRPRSLRLLDDEQLATLIAAGEREALEAAYARHLPALVRYCQSILLVREDAEDAAQNAMLAAMRALPGRPPALKLRAWLFRVAHNEAISLLRRRRPHEPLERAAASSSPDVAEAAATRARMDQLLIDLQALPARQRSALLMRELCGLDYDEIGGALDSSEHAAMQTVFEARTALMHYEQGRSLSCSGIQRLLSEGDRRSVRARRVRAHIRGCDGCQAFEFAISRRRRHLALLLPVAVTAAGSGGRIGFVGLGVLRRASALAHRPAGMARARLHDLALRAPGAPCGVRGAGVTVLLAAGGSMSALQLAHRVREPRAVATNAPIMAMREVPAAAIAHPASCCVQPPAPAGRHSCTRSLTVTHRARSSCGRLLVASAASGARRVAASGTIDGAQSVSAPASAASQSTPTARPGPIPSGGIQLAGAAGRTELSAGVVRVAIGAGSARVEVGAGPTRAQVSTDSSGVALGASIPAASLGAALGVTTGRGSADLTVHMSVSLLTK